MKVDELYGVKVLAAQFDDYDRKVLRTLAQQMLNEERHYRRFVLLDRIVVCVGIALFVALIVASHG